MIMDPLINYLLVDETYVPSRHRGSTGLTYDLPTHCFVFFSQDPLSCSAVAVGLDCVIKSEAKNERTMRFGRWAPGWNDDRGYRCF